MKINDLLVEHKSESNDFLKIMRDFLPLAMKELKLNVLPDLKLVKYIEDAQQPTFGKYVDDENRIYVGIEDRHPLDIIRTLAHELVHFKQGTEHRLDATSGHTGSPIENEAHEIAGIIMRNFNKQHPQYFRERAINLDEGKYSGSMEPLTAKGKEKSGAVAALERALLKAKKAGTEMNYENIDAMMQKICKIHNITGQKLHDEFVKANRLIPDNWIKKQVEESAAWQKSSGKNKNGGLNKKGVDSYRREHPGSHLQTAVTKKPSELKAGSKSAKRRKSFCARMKGMKKSRTSAKTAHDPNSRINKSLRKWHCESIEEMQELIMLGENYISNLKENFADGKHPGRKGLAKRSGVNTKASVSSLRNTAKHSSGEKARMAHWLANMKAGKAKAKKK
jgi:Zn-dependent peptidase ImmA (M78 family)